MGNPSPEDPPHSPWAERAKAAHYNAVENLVIFAPLVLAIHSAGISNVTTVFACKIYFWARITHYIVYTLGVPVARSLAFIAGFIAQMMLAFTLLF